MVGLTPNLVCNPIGIHYGTLKVWITCSQMEKSMRQHASLNNRSTKLCYEVKIFYL